MKIVSWNVNGIRAIVKKDFFKDFEDMNTDILCLQETKAQPDEVEKALESIEGYEKYYNSADKKGYSSTAILTKVKPISVTYDMNVEEHDKEGRIICAEFEEFFLVTVYVPNAGAGLKRLDYRQQWDADFLNYLKNLEKKKPVVVCGDLNVAHTDIDLKNNKSNYNKTAGYTQKEIDGFQAMIDAGFVDTFRKFYPEEVKYSYWSYRFNARKNNSGWRIDYFLMSDSLAPKLKSAEIHNEYFGSDHCPVSIELG